MSSTTQGFKQGNLYTIEFQQRPKYLYAFVSGRHDNIENARKCWLEMLDACHKFDYDKLLVEENIEGNISMEEMYKLATEFPAMGFQNILVAFVDLHPSHQKLNRFGETVATNRGGKVRVFDTVAEAKEWILVN